MPRRVLSVSYNKTLLDTRAMILRQHGYAVSSADNAQDAIELCRKGSFRAVLIGGHTIPPPDQRAIATAVRKACPGVVVLALRSYLVDDTSFADAVVDAFKPDQLVAELERIFGTDQPDRLAGE